MSIILVDPQQLSDKVSSIFTKEETCSASDRTGTKIRPYNSQSSIHSALLCYFASDISKYSGSKDLTNLLQRSASGLETPKSLPDTPQTKNLDPSVYLKASSVMVQNNLYFLTPKFSLSSLKMILFFPFQHHHSCGG